MTSYVSIQQRFRRQHNAGRPTIRSCCYPSLCTNACCGQPSCWYIEQSTGRPGINIRRKWWGANVSHITSWVQRSWRDRVGSGCWIWFNAFVAYAASNTESESSSAAKDDFTTASGRFAGVVLDISVSAFSLLQIICYVFCL